jgi:hypothetical protein
MGKAFKGSMTEKNLLTAFAGESQARNRYTYFARKTRRNMPRCSSSTSGGVKWRSRPHIPPA